MSTTPSRLTLAALFLAAIGLPLLAQDKPEPAAPTRFVEIPNRLPGAFLDTRSNKVYILKDENGLMILDPVAGTTQLKLFRRVDKTSFPGKAQFVTIKPFNRRRTLDLLDQRNGIICSIELAKNVIRRIDLVKATLEERELELKVDPKDKGALEAMRSQENEAAAIAALRTVTTAQAIFRESDRDRDGMFDYGSLQELGKTNLIDSKLASGSKQGYVFKSAPSTKDFEYLWWATAQPKSPQGGRYFFVNHSGVIRVSDKPIEVDLKTCEPTHKLKALGKK